MLRRLTALALLAALPSCAAGSQVFRVDREAWDERGAIAVVQPHVDRFDLASKFRETLTSSGWDAAVCTPDNTPTAGLIGRYEVKESGLDFGGEVPVVIVFDVRTAQGAQVAVGQYRRAFESPTEMIEQLIAAFGKPAQPKGEKSRRWKRGGA